MLLKDRVAVISGVGGGLGRQVALHFAREGAAVALGARTESRLKEVAAEVEALGGRAVPVTTDIADPEQCRRFVATAVDELGGVDCLVNVAAAHIFGEFEDADLAAWRDVFEVNVFGTLRVCQEVIPHMKERGAGSIVLVNSMATRKMVLPEGGYAASKGALLIAAQVLAKELGQYKIRVNSIVPGWMWGPDVQGYFQWNEQKTGRSVQEQYDEVASRIPLGAIPTDEECARAALFFASDLSAVVTGQALDVNGGEFFH